MERSDWLKMMITQLLREKIDIFRKNAIPSPKNAPLSATTYPPITIDVPVNATLKP